MAEPIETLYIELQGRLDGLERTLKQAEQRLAQAGQDGGEAFSKGFGSGIEQVITKIGSIGAIVAGGAIGLGAFDGLVRSVFSLAQEADRANTQAQLLAATLERNGISATAAEQSFRATADALGVLPQQLNESSKLLINYGATLDQVAKLQEIGGASALAAGRSAADGADLIAQAITTENSALLNGIGIASNLSTAYQNYGKEVGKTVEQLSAQEKTQAAVNYLLKETQSEVEALPTLLGGLAGQQSKLNNEFQKLQLALGEALIPAVTAAIRVLNGLLDNLPTIASAAATLAAIIGAQRLAGSFAVLNLSVTQGVSALAGWAATTVTTTTVTTALTGALNALKTFFLTSPAVIIAAGAALIQFAAQASSAIRAAEDAALASDRAFQKTEASRIAALRGSSNEIDQLKGRIAALQAALSSIQLGELGGNAEATAAKIKQLRGELAALQAEQAKQNTAQSSSNDLFREARTLVENLQKAQDSLSARQIFAAQQAIEAFTKANKDGSAVISAVRAAIAEQNNQLKENEKATKTATKAVSEWDNYLKSERLEAYRRGLEAMAEAQLRQEVANQRSSRAIEQLQAATVRLNEVQQRRIQLEQELATQAANAPLEQSLVRLERQYNLGTISARQYLDAANALLQSFSKQFAAATKGSDEYERLRGIILRLRDIQDSLKDTLEETSLAFQRQQAAIPLQNTLDKLAQSYSLNQINASEYKDAVDALLRSESAKFALLESGTTAYDAQRAVILQLRDIQADLISQLERENKARSDLQKTIIDQSRALRILSESGQESFVQAIAQQYVELSGLLSSGQVNARAAELADSLSRSLSSVQIDESTRAAIRGLLEELKKLADAGEQTQAQLAQDIEIPQSLFEFGNIIEQISTAYRANTALVQNNAITTDRALAIYTEQARIIQDVVDSLTQQLAAQEAANASTEDLAGTTEKLGKSKSLLDQLNQSILDLGGQSAQSLLILDKAALDFTETINQFSNEGGIAQAFAVPPESIDFRNALDAINASLLAVRQSLQLGIVDLDGFTAAQEDAATILQEFIAAVLDQAQALADSGQRGSASYNALIALANQAKTAFDELTSEIVQSSPRSAAALGIIDKATLAWQDTVQQTSEILAREFAPPPVLVDFKDALGGIGDELDALGRKFADGSIDIQTYQTAIGNVIDDLEVFSATISSLAQSYLQSADAADQALGAELTRLAQQAQQSIEGLRNKLYEVGATAPRIESVKDEVTKLGSQLAAVQLPDKLIEQVEDLIDILQFVPPDVFIDYRNALDNIGIELEDVKTQFEEGAISIEDYQFAVSNTISDLESFSRSLRELATFYLSLGEASDRALGANLLRLAQNAEKQIKSLNNEIYKIGSLAPRVTSVKDEVTKLGSELADVQIPDTLVQQIEEIIDALDFAPSPALINFQDALEDIGSELVKLGKDFAEGRVGIDEYQTGIINTIDDLTRFSTTLLELSQGYLNSADSAEQAFGAEFVQLAARAQAAIEALRDRLYQLGAAAPRIEQVKDEVTKLGSGLAQVQLPDKLVTQIEQIVDALDFVPDAKLIDFREALAGVTDELDVARESFLEGGSTIEQFQSGIIAAIDDLNNYVAAIRETAQAYLNSSDAADRAIGRGFLQLAKQAQAEVKKLTDELYRVGSTAPVFADVKDEVTKLGGELAAVQIPDRIFEDIEELVNAFDLAPERAFIDFSNGINDIIADLVRLDAQFASGTIVIEDYQQVLIARIDDLSGLVSVLQESQQALEAIGEGGSQSGQQIASAITAANATIQQLRDKLYEVGSQQPRVSGVKDEITKLGSELAAVQLPDVLPEQLDELQAKAEDFVVPATLIDFRNALEGISTQLGQTSDQFLRGNLSVDDYRQTLLNTVGDLEIFAGTLDALSQQYLNSGDAADQAFGAQLQQLVRSARNQIQDLGNELFNLNVDALVVDDLVQGFDRLDRTLARVQLPDVLPDADLRNLLTAAGIDFGNFAQLGAALNNIPAPLRASSTLFGDFAALVELSAQAEGRLAEAAGLALTQNQQLANQIRILAQELVVTGAISADVALRYLELANQVGNLSEQTKAGVDPFKALSTLTFQNFRELSISLNQIINPLTESGNAADLLQSALREAADGERLLSGAAAEVDNQFTRQAETIREYAKQLEATGKVAPELVARLRDLARSLDIQAPLEAGRKKTEQLKNELLEAINAFAGFSNLDIAGLDGLVSLSQGIAKLIGGDILGGIQSILAPYADLLEPILAPLGDAFTKVLKSIQPIIAPLAKLATSIIIPLVELIANVLTPVVEVFAGVFEQVGAVIQSVIDGLVYVYNQTLGKVFGQIGGGDVAPPLAGDEQALIDRVEEVIGKIDAAARAAILEMSKNIYETLYKSFESALAEGLFDAITSGNLDEAKRALEERLKKVVVQVIVDTAVKAAFATAAVADVLKKLSDEIAYAIATGDWSGVGAAIGAAVSTVTGILDQLASVLIPNLGGLFGGGGNVPVSPVNGIPSGPTAIQSPSIPITSPEAIAAFSAGSKDIATAGTTLLEGLQGLELDEVAADMARSSGDFRAAVDQLSGILTNRTDWAGVNSR